MALVAILIDNDDFFTALDGHKGHPYIFYENAFI
jgi:hypothetical protein